MASYHGVKYITQDPKIVNDLALRSGKVLLILLEEMCAVKTSQSVAQSLYDWLAPFIHTVIDGKCTLPSEAVFNFRLYDESGALEPYPLLTDALGVFSVSIHSAQPEDLTESVTELEADFARREVGAGRV